MDTIQISVDHNLTRTPSSSDPLFSSLKPSRIILDNGTCLDGISPTWQEADFEGEVVFTTGMTGYDASLTDPSYAGQILVFTYPLIGNYGVPDKSQWESERIYAKGVVVGNLCHQWSHGRSTQSLLEWLKQQEVALITGVDTRCLTKILREAGTMAGVITTSSHPVSKGVKESPEGKVSIAHPITYGIGEKRIVVVDCGMKANILRSLQRPEATLFRVPFDYDYSGEEFDGIVLSNGPGNPENYTATIAILKKALLRKKPIFGICLGAQLLALSVGAKTYKLPYGHRGHNQPCMDVKTKRCYMTSQNHGYAIKAETLPQEWQVSFCNLNDDTVEGIAHSKLPFSAVQFHPEAAPGPSDTMWLFNNFFNSL